MSLTKGFYIYKTMNIVTILPSNGEDAIKFDKIESYQVFDDKIILTNLDGEIKEVPTK